MNSLCIYFFLIYLFIEATQISLLFARIYINIITLHFVLRSIISNIALQIYNKFCIIIIVNHKVKISKLLKIR